MAAPYVRLAGNVLVHQTELAQRLAKESQLTRRERRGTVACYSADEALRAISAGNLPPVEEDDHVNVTHRPIAGRIFVAYVYVSRIESTRALVLYKEIAFNDAKHTKEALQAVDNSSRVAKNIVSDDRASSAPSADQGRTVTWAPHTDLTSGHATPGSADGSARAEAAQSILMLNTHAAVDSAPPPTVGYDDVSLSSGGSNLKVVRDARLRAIELVLIGEVGEERAKKLISEDAARMAARIAAGVSVAEEDPEEGLAEEGSALSPGMKAAAEGGAAAYGDAPDGGEVAAADGDATDPVGLCTVGHGVGVRASGLGLDAGMGLFAERAFKRGQPITEYAGERITSQKRSGARYVVDPDVFEAALRVDVQTHLAHSRFEGAHGAHSVVIDGLKTARVGEGGGSFANAHRPANARHAADTPDRIIVIATANIAAGQEIFVDYGTNGVAMGTHRLRAIDDADGRRTCKVRIDDDAGLLLDDDTRSLRSVSSRGRETSTMEHVPPPHRTTCATDEDCLDTMAQLARISPLPRGYCSVTDKFPEDAMVLVDGALDPKLVSEAQAIGCEISEGGDGQDLRCMTVRSSANELISYVSYTALQGWPTRVGGGYRAIFVWDLFTSPSHAMQGLASTLVTRLENLARAAGCDVIAASAKCCNGAGCRFWMRKMGWRVAEGGFDGRPGTADASLDIFRPLTDDVRIPCLPLYEVRLSTSVQRAILATRKWTQAEAAGRAIGYFLREPVRAGRLITLAHIGLPLNHYFTSESDFRAARPGGSDYVIRTSKHGNHLDMRSVFCDAGRINTAAGLVNPQAGSLVNNTTANPHGGTVRFVAKHDMEAGTEVLYPYAWHGKEAIAKRKQRD